MLAADFRIDMARAAVQRLLTRVDPPTAIFAANNLMTIGTMQAIRDMGLRCPHDISVAGIDDFSSSGLIEPLMTTVEQPIEAMGAAAMDCLLARLEAEAGRPRKPTPRKSRCLSRAFLCVNRAVVSSRKPLRRRPEFYRFSSSTNGFFVWRRLKRITMPGSLNVSRRLLVR